MGKIISAILGGGKKAPTVSAAAEDTTLEAKKKAKRSRATVLKTEGGIRGEELQPGSVGGLTNIFGN